MKRKPTYQLNNWSVYDRNAVGFALPTDHAVIFYGSVQGNPSFVDGSRIYTSQVTRTFKHSITTLNSRYKLGKPSDAYSKWLKEHGNG